MEIKFYTFGQYTPDLIFSVGGQGLWDDMCEAIADHVFGEDPESGTKASDLMDVVAMETVDGEDYVEAVYFKGELIGSLDNAFWHGLDRYVKI